ncbi:MAG: hypothetical protein CO035_06995 [Candidatus Omnitrophica bacterium CG_4_9_14_0_2_um_filter_42_8]|nr:MAG: hypothetical protein COW92_03890 [Candidatus Omnitrophica bacterium CG22_combo_CG10-13_8_21_14_all_43_16]PJC47185.1 MAG: hypothetical protein CO035_06995 [Candidatus Omnitrophica bacterium CG_4_9_14_0_2_um_filter_42_8]
MQKTFNFFYVFLLALLGFGVTLMAEDITLTTYYPAPYGNYEELQASKLAVGSSVTMPTADGNITAGGTIQANTYFNFNGTNGDTDTYIVITDLDIAGINLRKKTRTITVAGGIVTDVSSESNWEIVGKIN